MKSLGEIIKDYVDRLQTENSTEIVDEEMIKNIKNKFFRDENAALASVSEVFIDSLDAEDSIRYSFQFTETYKNGSSDANSLMMCLYIAATYDGFTLKNVIKYVGEIMKSKLAYPKMLADYFMRIISSMNKKVPLDLKLWLELQ
jgi:hypothetical protein